MQEELTKANNKLIIRDPLYKAKCILWDELSLQITKFRSYLNLIDDENPFVFIGKFEYKRINIDFEHMIVKVAWGVINYINITPKDVLRAIGVKNRESIIKVARKVI